VIKWFWYGNAAITLIAVLILLVGLGQVSSFGPDTSDGQVDKSKRNGQDTSGVSDSDAESPMVAAVRAYSERWRPKGAVQILIQPQAVLSKQPKWRLKTGSWWESAHRNYEWQDPNAVIDKLRADGNRTVSVEFQEIEGWIKPKDQVVKVVKNKVTPFQGTYKIPQPMGTLIVTLSPPEAVKAKMRWRAGSKAWQYSGGKIEVTTGSHQVSFSPFPGWDPPSAISVHIHKDQITKIAGTYIEKPKGSLQVLLEPNEVIPQAKWRYGNTAWQKNGARVEKIPVGNYPLEWSTVAGWRTPQKTTILIDPNEVTQVRAIYEEIPKGGIRVTLAPESVVQGKGQWRLDTGAWQSSGATVKGILAGAHSISPKPVSGWNPPKNQTVTITANQIAEVTLVYTKPPPPAPKFKLKATMIAGGHGVAWILHPGKSKPQLYFLHEQVGPYKISEIYDGFINVTSEGQNFKVAVPKPTPIDKLKPPLAKSTPGKAVPPRKPTPPKRTNPPRPSSVDERIRRIQEEREKRK
jgi:hypothetical protein